MPKENYITFFSHKRKHVLDISSILYTEAENGHTQIHTRNGDVFPTRSTLCELEDALGATFIKIRRNCLVSVAEIASVSERVNLKNGEALKYAIRQRKRIVEELCEKKTALLPNPTSVPKNDAEFQRHYAVLENFPVAFADFAVSESAESEKDRLILCYQNSQSQVFQSIFSSNTDLIKACCLAANGTEAPIYVNLGNQLCALLVQTFHGHCGCFLLTLPCGLINTQ